MNRPLANNTSVKRVLFFERLKLLHSKMLCAKSYFVLLGINIPIIFFFDLNNYVNSQL